MEFRRAWDVYVVGCRALRFDSLTLSETLSWDRILRRFIALVARVPVLVGSDADEGRTYPSEQNDTSQFLKTLIPMRLSLCVRRY